MQCKYASIKRVCICKTSVIHTVLQCFHDMQICASVNLPAGSRSLVLVETPVGIGGFLLLRKHKKKKKFVLTLFVCLSFSITM